MPAGTGIRLIHGTTVADDQAHYLVFNSQGEDWIIVDLEGSLLPKE